LKGGASRRGGRVRSERREGEEVVEGREGKARERRRREGNGKG